MSDKSHGAEPEREEIASGEPDAETAEAHPEEAVDEREIEVEEIVEVDEAGDGTDETIAALEEEFTPEEHELAAAGITRRTAKAPVRKKDRATPRRDDSVDEHDDPYKAKNPVEFAKQSGSELKKVVWPTWPQTVSMFTSVLIFVLIMIAIVSLLDVVFGWSLLKLLGS